MAAYFVLYISYLLFFPVNVLEIKNEPLTIKNKVVERGEKLTFISDYCKYIDVPSRTDISFVNHDISPALLSFTNAPKGCHVREFHVGVPLTVNPGKQHLLILVTYRINPIREEHYKFVTEDFIVQ